MKRILMVGDYRTGSGPANVTLKYIEGLGKRCFYLHSASKPLRAAELILKIPFSSVVLCSGYSAQNILSAKTAHFFGKKCAYLDHGSVEYENRINLCEDPHMTRIEYETLRLCDRIFAVSSRFSLWLKERYPEFSDKTEPQLNGIGDFDRVYRDSTERDPDLIFSIGGGMPRKRINRICQAIELLLPKRPGLKLVVAGAEGAFSEEIRRYPFVRDLGILDKESIRKLFRSSSLFIQNSCFETFGLAPMEALANGCDVLLSAHTGALELFRTDEPGLERYIIKDCEDASEIARRINESLGSGNAALFRKAVKETSSWEVRTEELYQKLRSLSISE